MAVTPAGSPVWLRTNDHTSYGGHLNKANYQSIGAVNPRTDVTAEQIARLAEDVAALGRVAPFAVVIYTCNDSGTPAAPTIDYYYAMAGSAPTPARVSDGVASFTWPASVSDVYSQPGSVHIVGARAQLMGSTSGMATCVLADPDTNGLNERITITIVDDAGSAIQDPQVKLEVWTGPV